MIMFKHEREILASLSDLLRDRFGEDIQSVYAFGSRVRGDNDGLSDFDLLVVVKDRTPEKEKNIIGAIVDFEMERDMSFTPVLKDAGSFALEKKFNAPFYRNIAREGVLL